MTATTSTVHPTLTAPPRAWALDEICTDDIRTRHPEGWEHVELAGWRLAFDPSAVRVVRVVREPSPGVQAALRDAGYRPVLTRPLAVLWVGPVAPR